MKLLAVAVDGVGEYSLDSEREFKNMSAWKRVYTLSKESLARSALSSA